MRGCYNVSGATAPARAALNHKRATIERLSSLRALPRKSVSWNEGGAGGEEVGQNAIAPYPGSRPEAITASISIVVNQGRAGLHRKRWGSGRDRTQYKGL